MCIFSWLGENAPRYELHKLLLNPRVNKEMLMIRNNRIHERKERNCQLQMSTGLHLFG